MSEENSVALVKELIAELKSSPNTAVEFVKALSKITKPWEPIGYGSTPTNTMNVPDGVSAKQFAQETITSSINISGYRLSTIFGKEVAIIQKATPRWKISIEGAYQSDAPFVSHAQKAESQAKQFVEERLKELGYIVGYDEK